MSKSRMVVRLSPLGLLSLTACVRSNSTLQVDSVSTSGSTSGFAFQGPLSNALIYIDYDDAALGNSATVRTGANGNYTLSTLNNNYTIVVVTDDSTIDTSSGSVFSGVTMKAASGGTAVSTATTMMVEGGLTVAQLNAVLGLSADIDHLTFNPFALAPLSVLAQCLILIALTVLVVLQKFGCWRLLPMAAPPQNLCVLGIAYKLIC